MKNLNVNWKEFVERRGIPLVLATTLSIGLAGCGEKAECDVPESHAHLYVNEEGFSRYLEKEYLDLSIKRFEQVFSKKDKAWQ